MTQISKNVFSFKLCKKSTKNSDFYATICISQNKGSKVKNMHYFEFN